MKNALRLLNDIAVPFEDKVSLQKMYYSRLRTCILMFYGKSMNLACTLVNII